MTLEVGNFWCAMRGSNLMTKTLINASVFISEIKSATNVPQLSSFLSNILKKAPA